MSAIKCYMCGTGVRAGDDYHMSWHEPRRWYVLTHNRGGRLFCGIAGWALENGVFIRRSSARGDERIPSEGINIIGGPHMYDPLLPASAGRLLMDLANRLGRKLEPADMLPILAADLLAQCNWHNMGSVQQTMVFALTELGYLTPTSNGFTGAAKLPEDAGWVGMAQQEMGRRLAAIQAWADNTIIGGMNGYELSLQLRDMLLGYVPGTDREEMLSDAAKEEPS